MKPTFTIDIKSTISSILTGIKMALIEMKTHKLRSFLSILGVMLGTASLVAMLTLIGGINKFLNEKMNKWVGSVWYWSKSDPSGDNKILWSRSPGLKLNDLQYLKDNSTKIKAIFPKIIRHGLIHFGKVKENIVLKGVDSTTLRFEQEEIKIEFGRWINDNEFSSGLRNCVISKEIANSIVKEFHLKKRSEVINKYIVFRNVQLNIVGTYLPVNEGNNYWELQRGIIIPLNTMKKYITGNDPNPGSFQIQLNDPRHLMQNANSVAKLLIGKHRGVEDFEFHAAEWADKISQMFKNLSIIMAVISILSLSVGGLSIMNVMLSSISERIKEIGTRKALGANNAQIFTQFIAETTTLSFSGGTIGSSLGCIPLLFKEEIKKASEGSIEPTILFNHIIVIFIVIIGIGILFGLYPAIKASKMNPIEALRYE